VTKEKYLKSLTQSEIEKMKNILNNKNGQLLFENELFKLYLNEEAKKLNSHSFDKFTPITAVPKN